MKRVVSLVLVLGLAAFLAVADVHADVRLPKLFGDHMVVQRNQPTVVWGWADAGEKVTVDLAGNKADATAGSDGKWSVKVSTPPAGGPYELTIAGKNTVKLSDVLVGEVWICSGQSNMEWSVRQSQDAEKEIAAANHARIRHIKVEHTPADKPQDDLVTKQGWQVCTPESVPAFTAVGYFFARNLQDALDVPVGLIGSNWGGTRIEPWTPPVGFEQVPALKDIADQLSAMPAKLADGKINHQTPLALYNGMIHPLVPFAVQGAIWYQGESNNGEGMLYFEKKKALIGGWRKLWDRPEMPFYFVQLAPYKYGANRQPADLAGIWEAQLKSLEIPHTGMAVTVDIGDVKDIHPRNKQEVGRRLALWALAKTYGKQLVYSGPLYASHAVEGDKIRIKFQHAGGGLTARDGKPLSHFEIAGDDGNFVAATATIDGATVVVHSEKVAKPSAVRFAWDQIAEPNLSNQEGLPASPFRTSSK
ncbi:MAG: sialate O-acetylesterase [Pirellulaceae bacterium]